MVSVRKLLLVKGLRFFFFSKGEESSKEKKGNIGIFICIFNLSKEMLFAQEEE